THYLRAHFRFCGQIVFLWALFYVLRALSYICGRILAFCGRTSVFCERTFFLLHIELLSKLKDQHLLVL
ncbi:MAG: hypothetical protein LRY71_13160, partial [Bacillaceae bacterium]|nr:hypothetical protein [Bacillaceae bacterium]